MVQMKVFKSIEKICRDSSMSMAACDLNDLMGRLPAVRASLVVLHEPHTAVSHPSPLFLRILLPLQPDGVLVRDERVS
jgi:hypothetical protein